MREFAQKSCFPNSCYQFQHIWPLFINFSKNHQKNWWKLKIIKNLLNISKSSKFWDFWGISTCNTFKESIFYIEINFQTEKVWFVWRKIENIKFYWFFLSKSMLTTCHWQPISQICAKKIFKLSLCFGKYLESKVTKGELVISIHLEMADS